MASGDKDICARVLFAANKAKSISLLLISFPVPTVPTAMFPDRKSVV